MAADAGQEDPRGALLDAAEGALVAALADDGVVRVEYVAAFPRDPFAVWLGTATDRERDRLAGDDPLIETVRAVLLRQGFREQWLRHLMTVVQSQETVDRDYEGSWFHTLR